MEMPWGWMRRMLPGGSPQMAEQSKEVGALTARPGSWRRAVSRAEAMSVRCRMKKNHIGTGPGSHDGGRSALLPVPPCGAVPGWRTHHPLPVLADLMSLKCNIGKPDLWRCSAAIQRFASTFSPTYMPDSADRPPSWLPGPVTHELPHANVHKARGGDASRNSSKRRRSKSTERVHR
jgi:hypothetical protein